MPVIGGIYGYKFPGTGDTLKYDGVRLRNTTNGRQYESIEIDLKCTKLANTETQTVGFINLIKNNLGIDLASSTSELNVVYSFNFESSTLTVKFAGIRTYQAVLNVIRIFSFLCSDGELISLDYPTRTLFNCLQTLSSATGETLDPVDPDYFVTYTSIQDIHSFNWIPATGGTYLKTQEAFFDMIANPIKNSLGINLYDFRNQGWLQYALGSLDIEGTPTDVFQVKFILNNDLTKTLQLVQVSPVLMNKNYNNYVILSKALKIIVDDLLTTNRSTE